MVTCEADPAYSTFIPIIKRWQTHRRPGISTQPTIVEITIGVSPPEEIEAAIRLVLARRTSGERSYACDIVVGDTENVSVPLSSGFRANAREGRNSFTFRINHLDPEHESIPCRLMFG